MLPPLPFPIGTRRLLTHPRELLLAVQQVPARGDTISRLFYQFNSPSGYLMLLGALLLFLLSEKGNAGSNKKKFGSAC